MFVSALNQKGCKLLISGCSTSYNRYSYDPEFRVNATDCGVGMGSWSFQLRDRIIASDPQFVYGTDITFSCDSLLGLDNDSPVPFTAMFGGRVQTLLPRENVSFTVPLRGNEGVLYLQRRIDAPCVFDLEVDGETVLRDISTAGTMIDHAGYGLMRVVFPCSPDKKEHQISIKNIRGNTRKITVVGVGARDIQIRMSGQGGQTARFFINNFEERIGQFEPDVLVFTLGANDRVLNSPNTFRKDLSELLTMLFDRFPNCKMLYLLPPTGHNPACPDTDCEGYTSLLTEEVYDRIIRNTCAQFGTDRIATLAMKEVFAPFEVARWRFDNIHMNCFGNDLLYNAVLKKMEL